MVDNALRSDDGLCLGVRALELASGVCPQTIRIFTSVERIVSTPNVQADSTRYVIKDFTADAHFKTRPYVKGWPHMRSYAEVPPKSSSGYVVGSYCVVDTRPRNFDDSEIQVLDSVGVTIMKHLELLKSQLELRRVQRLVRGIGSYAAGYSGLQETPNRPSLGAPTQIPFVQLSKDNSSLPIKLVRDDSNETISRPAMNRVHAEETIESVSAASLETPVTSVSARTTSESSYSDPFEPQEDGDGPPGSAERLTPEEILGLSGPAPTPDHSTANDAAHGETTFSKDASTAVSRASHLIRQSMDLGGVVFVVCHIASSLNQAQLTRQLSETARADCWLLCQCQHHEQTRFGTGRSQLRGDRSLSRR